MSSTNPQISVVVSCYNASRWMSGAIDSVLGQTFPDFELILIDDGSTDDTWSIIEDYRSSDRRIVSLRKNNSGLADSLNTGLSMARGEWVARLDADDLSTSTRLEEQLAFVRRHPDVVLVGTGFTEVDGSGRALRTHRYPPNHALLVWHLEHMARFFPHSSAFYRLSEARRVKGYNVRFQRAQDWRLWLDLSTVGRIACLRKSLVSIRKHSDQISLTNKGARQMSDAMAGTVGHLLRKAGYKDPCCDDDESHWREFLEWIENKVAESGFVERQGVWNEARSRLLHRGPGVRGGFAFGTHLISSGFIVPQLAEHLFGLSLPGRLMRDWVETKCAA